MLGAARQAARRRAAGRRHRQQARSAAAARGADGDADDADDAPPLLAELHEAAGRAARAAGRDAADPADGRRPGGRRGRRRLDRHPGRPDGARTRSRPCCKLADTLGQRVIGQDHAHGDDRQAHPDLARRPRQPEQADRRVHAGRHLGRRQDRDRARAGRGALRRRAEPDHHQHERVPGGAHRLDAQGRAARLRRLRRRRRADRGGAPQALQRGAARRGGEGAPRRARDVLPGVRQGLHGRRRRPRDRLQEHADPADHQRRHRPDHEHVQGPGADARPRRHGQGAARAAAEGLPAGAARPAGRRSRTTRSRRDARHDRPAAARTASRSASRRNHKIPFDVRRRRGQAGRRALHRERIAAAA